MDGPAELFEVWYERLVNPDFANGRADGAEPESGAVKQRLEVAHLRVSQRQDVGLVDRSELDVPDTAVFQNVDLHLRVGGNLVGECAQDEHGHSRMNGAWTMQMV